MAMHAQIIRGCPGVQCQPSFPSRIIPHLSLRTSPVNKSRLLAAALPPSLQNKCEEWLSLDRETHTVGEARQAIDAEDEALLQDALEQRLVFGQ